jgi:hypothetical protein
LKVLNIEYLTLNTLFLALGQHATAQNEGYRPKCVKVNGIDKQQCVYDCAV